MYCLIYNEKCIFLAKSIKSYKENDLKLIISMPGFQEKKSLKIQLSFKFVYAKIYLRNLPNREAFKNN